jgi:hypothetical protein
MSDLFQSDYGGSGLPSDLDPVENLPQIRLQIRLRSGAGFSNRFELDL